MRIDSSGGLITKPAAGGHAVFNEDGVDADFRIESDTNTHAFFLEGSSGNVGIGTSSPGAKLDVVGNAKFLSLTASMFSTTATTGVAGIFSIARESVAKAIFALDGSDNFCLYNAAGSVQNFTFTNSGNLGIGTSSFVYSAAGRGLVEVNGTSSALVGLQINGVAGGYFFDDGTDVEIGGPTGRNITFDINGERMRLNSTGLGIGTTSPAVKLDVSGAIRASTGVLFGSDTAAANTLDDYEEGTWTPTIVGATTAGTGTYTYQVGRYTKIGNRVFFVANMRWTAHTGTGDMNIGALPFTSLDSANSGGSVTVGYLDNITLSASNTLTGGFVLANNTEISLKQNPVAGGASANVTIDAVGAIWVSGHYEV